jgi:Trk K+ transport system NAD-binding subunit
VKSLALIFSTLGSGKNRSSVRLFLKLIGLLVVMVAVFSAGFHWVMAREGQSYSWPSSVYWTLVTMSTVGFGDITFRSDLGRMYSIVVLLAGSMFILVLLPFTFIQFVFLPWMESRRNARAPRRVAADMSGHVVLTQIGPIEEALIERLDRAKVPYVVLEPNLEAALALHDRGVQVMVGELDDPATYDAARVADAALVATTRSDPTNTNVAFTIREIDPTVPIIATASTTTSVDVLELAGCSQILQLGEMLGAGFAQRVLKPGAATHVVGEFGPLLVAEASVAGTSLVGTTIGSSRLREEVAVNVVGIWDRGHFRPAEPEAPITDHTVLVVAGTRSQLDAFDARFSVEVPIHHNVLIIGGGRVGRAIGRRLTAAGIDHCIVEREPGRVPASSRVVVGDAADIDVLREAGFESAETVIVTTHDDDINVYLALYCRKLRPDVQVLARANLDRNVSTLHRAGADAVLSYTSAGATAIWNALDVNATVVLAEGLDVFRCSVPDAVAGRSLRDGAIRAETGATVVAVLVGDELVSTPTADTIVPSDAELILIGDEQAEDRFLRLTGATRR